MQFIRDSLGYRDELLGEYDSRQRYSYFSRSETKKIERIGKKYQWIAMYNILARTSDHHLLKEWNEDNFDVNIIPYTKEAYEAKKYAFVSDYARMWILY